MNTIESGRPVTTRLYALQRWGYVISEMIAGAALGRPFIIKISGVSQLSGSFSFLHIHQSRVGQGCSRPLCGSSLRALQWSERRALGPSRR